MQPVVQRHTALSASTKANHNLLKTTPAQIPTPVAAIPEKGTEPNLTPGSISGINVGSSVNNLPLTSTASHQNFSPGVISAPHRNTGSNQVSVNGSSTASSTNNKEQGPTYSELGIVTERPKRSEYAVKEQRIKTFSSWPRSHHLDVGDLADAGFYYAGYSDCARCFFCGGGLRNWEEEDNVFVEHARWFPKCAFIRELLGQNFVDAVQELNKTKDKITWSMSLNKMKAPVTDVSEKLNFQKETCDFRSKKQNPSKEIDGQFKNSSILDDLFSCNNIRLKNDNIQCYVIHLRTEHNHPTHIGGVAWNDFKYEMLRLGTFCNYPSNASKSAIILAGDGFVYIGSGRDDAVMCYACCWIKCNWLEDEDVSQVHSMMSRHCSMTKRTDSDNVPIPPVNVRFEDILGYLQMLKRYILTVTNDQSTELEIITERPKYEAFVEMETRLKTLYNRRLTRGLDVTRLAKSGFYVEGSGCGFTCYFCGGGITNWENDNDPLVEHARLFPNCGHIRLYMGPHFVQTVRELAKSPERVTFDNVIQSLGPMAFTISHITMDHDVAVRVMLEFGFDKEHVLKAARDLRQEGCQLTVDALKQRIDQNTGIMLHGHEATMIDTTTNEAIQLLKESNRAIRQKTICKICEDENVQIAFVPCGHNVSCVECALKLRQCPVCRKHIKGMVRSFLS